MKPFEWNQDKNAILQASRGLGFDDVIEALDNNRLLATINHPNQKKYPGQKVYIVNINYYCYIIPFVESTEKIFLKTIIPSRKDTKKYLAKGNNL